MGKSRNSTDGGGSPNREANAYVLVHRVKHMDTVSKSLEAPVYSVVVIVREIDKRRKPTQEAKKCEYTGAKAANKKKALRAYVCACDLCVKRLVASPLRGRCAW